MKKVNYLILILSLFLVSKIHAQGSDVLIQNGIEITKSTYGLGHDDQILVDFFKKNKYWNQTTKNEKIEIEFLGFEIPNSISKPFQFGKSIANSNPNSIAQYIVGSSYSVNNFGVSTTIIFGDYGTVDILVGNRGSLRGTYNWNDGLRLVYVNIPDSPQDIYQIQIGTGKNLGITGEAVDNIHLINTKNGVKYTKSSNSEIKSGKIDNTWALPENRYLLKYTITHDRLMTENGRTVTKKNQVEEKYVFVKKFIILEREVPGGGIDYYGRALADTNNPWKTVMLEVVSSVNNKPYTPGMSAQELLRSPYGLVNLKLINWGITTDNKNLFQNSSSKNRLYISTALNRSGWDLKDGAISSISGNTMTYNIQEDFYLSPSRFDSKTSSSFGTDIDANCVMSFRQVLNAQAGVKLSDVIFTEVYKLEANSSLLYKNLGDKIYSFELVSKKLFGKEKSRKGVWFVNLNNQTVVFKFDDGEKNEFLITKIRDGYFYQFKDGAGILYELAKVDPK